MICGENKADLRISKYLDHLVVSCHLRHGQRFERIETVAVFVRISFGVADHSGLAD